MFFTKWIHRWFPRRITKALDEALLNSIMSDRRAFQQKLNTQYAGLIVEKFGVASVGKYVSIHFCGQQKTLLEFNRTMDSGVNVNGVSTLTFKAIAPDVVGEAMGNALWMSFQTFHRLDQYAERLYAFGKNLEAQYVGSTLLYIEIGEHGNVYMMFKDGSIMTVSSCVDDRNSDLRVNGLSTSPYMMQDPAVTLEEPLSQTIH